MSSSHQQNADGAHDSAADASAWATDTALLHEVAALLEQSPPFVSPSAAGGELEDQDLALLHELLDAQSHDHFRQPERQLPTAPPTQASAAVPAASEKERAAPKTTRERQKEELVFLRAKVVELETELEHHKQQHRALVVAAPDARHSHGNGSSTGTSSSVSWWAKAAQNQKDEKTKAEHENLKLRDMVLGQIRLAKSLENMLEKRRVSSPTAR